MIRVATFNIQNDYRRYSKDKSLEILRYLNENKIDILGLQEVYCKVEKDLCKNMTKNYSFYGKYRFMSKFFLKRINEMTPIITNKKVIEKKNYHLPYLPSLLKRVMTKEVIEYKDKKISIYNTHLDYKYDIVRKRQLNKIYKIIKEDNNYIILMGDFNLKNNNPIFIDFINNINLQHIDIGEKTLKCSKYHRAIDHIFIDKRLKIKNRRLVTDIETSDHYSVMIDIEL